LGSLRQDPLETSNLGEFGQLFGAFQLSIFIVYILLLPFHSHFVEPSGVHVLKNPNPLNDVEAFALLVVVVLV